VENNLFARTATLARVEGVVLEPARTPASWIWAAAGSGRACRAEERCFFRKTFAIAGPSVRRGVLNIACNAEFAAWVNGVRVGGGEFRPPVRAGRFALLANFRTSTRRVSSFDVTRHPHPGLNVVAVQGTGQDAGAGRLAELTWKCPRAAPMTLATDSTWNVSRGCAEEWTRADFVDTAWAAAREMAPYSKGQPAWQGLV
jgi:alpha-L-rhamnosidase